MSNENFLAGELLRELRKKENKNQGEIAKLINLAQSRWSAYETGKPVEFDKIVPVSETVKIHPVVLALMLLDRYMFPEFSEIWLAPEDFKSIIEEIEKKRKVHATEALERYQSYFESLDG